LVELLNLTFPSPPFPPFATTNLCPFLVKSNINVLSSSSNIWVPTGTFRIKSDPFLPVLFLLLPSSPFSDLKCCLYLKSISVFKFLSAIKICKKKRIGPSRTEDNRALFYRKDISLLARNGFDFETSKRVMDLKKDDYLKIISLI